MLVSPKQRNEQPLTTVTKRAVYRTGTGTQLRVPAAPGHACAVGYPLYLKTVVKRSASKGPISTPELDNNAILVRLHCQYSGHNVERTRKNSP